MKWFCILLALPVWGAAGQGELTVLIHGQKRQIALEDYVAGVVAGEAGVLRSPEARRAMAVAARTFAVRFRGRHAASGYDFCANTHCQNLKLSAVNEQAITAAESTSGELLWFDGRAGAAYYSQDCGGTTTAGREAWPGLNEPYLKQQNDPYCLRHGAHQWESTVSFADLQRALEASGLHVPKVIEGVALEGRTDSGRNAAVQVSGNGQSLKVAANTFRVALGQTLSWNTIPSDWYRVSTSGKQASFQGRGRGHGVGMCQYGADEMGLEGRSYREILAFYYPGTRVGITAQGLSWSRVGGERVELFTIKADDAAALMAVAERLTVEIESETGLRLPQHPRLRVFPSVETFRNATGEPGWVAASTRGRVIRLQPVAKLQANGSLRETLRHEMLHLAVENSATPGLPLWFREGLVEYLARPGSHAANEMDRASLDAAIRQTSDEKLARRAYAGAQAEVADLVRQHGLKAVLGWLAHGGLPVAS